jgi:hypothetical protein
VQRVRATVRGLVSHPNAITVDAEEGRVTVSGPILEAEVKPLIEHVSSMPGVAAVEQARSMFRIDPLAGRPRLTVGSSTRVLSGSTRMQMEGPGWI